LSVVNGLWTLDFGLWTGTAAGPFFGLWFLISIPKVNFQNEPDNDRQTPKTKDLQLTTDY
jgi:hypothetical protein